MGGLILTHVFTKPAHRQDVSRAKLWVGAAIGVEHLDAVGEAYFGEACFGDAYLGDACF